MRQLATTKVSDSKNQNIMLPRGFGLEVCVKTIFDSGTGYSLKWLIILCLSAIFFDQNELSPMLAPILPFLIEPDIFQMPKQYKPAKLFIPDGAAKDQRWCVEFYVYNAQQGKVVRKRDYRCNKIADLKKRKTWANKYCEAINQKLDEGYHIDSEKLAKQELEKRAKNNNFISIAEAMEIAMAAKKNLRPKTLKNYKDYLHGFLKTIDTNLHINTITAKSLKPFLLNLNNRVGPRTYNNYISHNSTLFNWLLTEEIIKENPWVKAPRLDNGVGKNLAYQKEQQTELLQHMDAHFPQMRLYCETIYYTLARPNEISHMQIKHLEMYRARHMFIPAAISKNNTDRHVALPEPIYKKLIELKKLPGDWYLFGKGLVPGPQFLDPRYVSDSYRTRVLKKLSYPSDYTLYSWKHTGVVTNYMAGLSPASLRMQIGHNDTGSFEKYLKSLGLFENKEVMENYVEL
jgi:integrase